MHPLIRSIGKLCIAAFVVWHAFAVAIYTIPRDSKDKYSALVKEKVLPRVTPYMLATSQWQLWNLFSPDPLRRVTYYHIQAETNSAWRDVMTLKPKTFSIWRHAARFKLLGNTFNEFEDKVKPLGVRYLQRMCETENLADGTPIRLVYEYFVIPLNEKPMGVAWWRQWQPEVKTYEGLSTACLSQS